MLSYPESASAGRSSSVADQFSAAVTPSSRAQLVSCRCPGFAGEVQIGRPSGRMIAWIFAPKLRCFPEYQASIVSPLTLVVVSVNRSQCEQFPVEDHVRPPVRRGPAQGGVQVLGLAGEDGDAFVAVPVRGCPGDPESGTQQHQVLAFAEPDEDE